MLYRTEKNDALTCFGALRVVLASSPSSKPLSLPPTPPPPPPLPLRIMPLQIRSPLRRLAPTEKNKVWSKPRNKKKKKKKGEEEEGRERKRKGRKRRKEEEEGALHLFRPTGR